MRFYLSALRAGLQAGLDFCRERESRIQVNFNCSGEVRIVSWFKEAKPGDRIGSDELTRLGAAALNGYRARVAAGERPTVSELIANGLFGHGRKERKDLMGDELKAAKKLMDGDKETFPGRNEWPLSRVDDWVAARTPVKKT